MSNNITIKLYKGIKNAKVEIDKISNEISKSHSTQSYYVLSKCDSPLYWLIRRHRIYVYSIYKNDKLKMIIPLRKINNKTFTVAGMQEGLEHIDFLYNTNNSDEIKELIQYFFRFLKDNGCEKVIFNFFDSDSKLIKIIKEGKFNITDINDIEGVIINKEFDDYDSYFNSLSKHVRQNLRTAYNRLKKDQISYDLEIYRESDNSTRKKELLKQCEKIYKNRQANRYNKDGIFYRVLYKYVHYLKYIIKEGKCFLAVLKTDKDILGFMIGYENEIYKTIEIPRLAINDNYQFYSPGMILLNETMKYLYSGDNFLGIDLGRGAENYKTNMGGQIYITNEFELTL